MTGTLTSRRGERQCANSYGSNDSLCLGTKRPPLGSSSEPAKADRDFAPADEPPDRRQIFAAQYRLLAARAEAGLPVDLRSLRNMVVVFFQGMAA